APLLPPPPATTCHRRWRAGCGHELPARPSAVGGRRQWIAPAWRPSPSRSTGQTGREPVAGSDACPGDTPRPGPPAELEAEGRTPLSAPPHATRHTPPRRTP